MEIVLQGLYRTALWLLDYNNQPLWSVCLSLSVCPGAAVEWRVDADTIEASRERIINFIDQIHQIEGSSNGLR